MLLKDLPDPLRLNRTHKNGNSFKKYVENLAGPMPHGFTWGLVLLKDLSRLPILCRTYMMKNHFLKI